MNSHFLNEVGPPGNPGIVNLLEVIALFILIIAWVNYVNLTTARAVEGAKEVGIRKVMGGNRRSLMGQFFAESFFYNLAAVVLGIWLVQLTKAPLEAFIGQNLGFSIFSDTNSWFLILGILIVGTFVAGIYPAMVLSGYRPVRVLKGSFKSSSQGNALRKSLTVFQFAASVALIAGTIAIYYQIQYMRSQDLGFNQDHLLVFEQPNLLDSTIALREQKLERMEAALDQNPYVKQFTRSLVVPGNLNETGIVIKREPSDDLDDAQVANFLYVDNNYVETYEMELLAGAYFNKSYRDSAAVILTESAAAMLEFSSPQEAVNEFVYLFGRQPMQVRGVVSDFHQESLKEKVAPSVFLVRPEASRYFSLRVSRDNLSEGIVAIEKSFADVFPAFPFEYFFIDDYFNRLYQDDIRYGRMIAVFAGLSIFIACLGLFGLASFMVVQRKKEIGIRKVLGATIGQILALLSRSYVFLLLLASLIGLPVAYYASSKWMENYAYRIDLGWWFFVVPLLLMGLIAFVSLSYQSLRAAFANPIDALRQE